MRPVTVNLNPVRENKGLNVKRKFILAFEGYRTEVRYFQGVNNHRSKLGISSLIEIYPLCRFPTQSGYSDPERVLDLLEDYITFLRYGNYSSDLFINTFINEMIQEEEIPEIKDKIETYMKAASECLLPLSDENKRIKNLDKAKEVCFEIYCEIFGNQKDIDFDFS